MSKCKLGLIWKPCPRSPFNCGRCYAKMRNTGRTWNIVIPTYQGGIYLNDQTLEPYPLVGQLSRVLEYDVGAAGTGDYYGLGDGTLFYFPCTWTNYGQKLFDQRLMHQEQYDASDGEGGYLDSSHWPAWVLDIVPDSDTLRTITRDHKIYNLSYVPPEYDDDHNLLDDAHYRIELYHWLIYYISSPGDGSLQEVIVAGVVSGGFGALQTYRCYDVDKCPLADGDYMRFNRDLPTEPFVWSGSGGPAGYYQEVSSYILPPYLDGYHVDIDPIE